MKYVCSGIALIVIGICLLVRNEGTSINPIKALKEASAVLVQVDSGTVDAANEGKLVATNGKINVVDESVGDTLFGVAVKTAKLQRIVEVYQWEETVGKDSKNKKTYSYKNVWSDNILSSNGFHDKAKINPRSMPLTSEIFVAKQVTLGAFALSDVQKQALPTDATVAAPHANDFGQMGFVLSGEYLTNSATPTDPQIGDIRVKYVYQHKADVSLAAQQSGNTFTDYVTKSGVKLNAVVDGLKPGTAIDIVPSAPSAGGIGQWMRRLLGMLLLTAGMWLVLKPPVAAGVSLPLIGTRIGVMSGVFVTVLGVSMGLAVIALSWIVVKPLLATGLLAIAVVLLVLSFTKGKKIASWHFQKNKKETTK